MKRLFNSTFFIIFSMSLATNFYSYSSDSRSMGWPGVTFKENKWTAKADYIKASFEALNSIDGKLKDLGGHDADTDDSINKKKTALLTLRKNILAQLGGNFDANLDAKMGRVVMKGLAGDQWRMLEDEEVKGFYDGVKLGLLTNVASGCGKVVNKKTTDTIHHVFGGFWDYCLGSLIDLWNDVGSLLFHGGYDPFRQEDLRHWGALVQGCFKNVEKVIKNGLKDSSRGRDMTFRPHADGDDEAEEEHEASEAHITAWNLLIRGYADQLDHVIVCIDSRISYYEDASEEAFYARQIKTRLLEFRNMLLSAESIKSFDDYIESNKSFIPALRDNVISLFAHLERKVTPRSYSLDKNAKSSEKSPWSNTDDDDDDDDAFGSFRRF